MKYWWWILKIGAWDRPLKPEPRSAITQKHRQACSEVKFKPWTLSPLWTGSYFGSEWWKLGSKHISGRSSVRDWVFWGGSPDPLGEGRGHKAPQANGIIGTHSGLGGSNLRNPLTKSTVSERFGFKLRLWSDVTTPRQVAHTNTDRVVSRAAQRATLTEAEYFQRHASGSVERSIWVTGQRSWNNLACAATAGCPVRLRYPLI